MVSSVCTDGAPAMIGCRCDLRALIKNDALHIRFTDCMLHRQALVSKMLPPKLAKALKVVVETANYVRGRALNHRIFMKLGQQMDLQFKSFCTTLKFVGYVGKRWLIAFLTLENYSYFWKTKTTSIQNSSKSLVFFLFWIIWATSLASELSNARRRGEVNKD